MRKSSALFLATLVFLATSCREKKGCEYYGSIQQYFSAMFRFKLADVKGTAAYYFLPLEGCENCVHENLIMLSSLQSDKVTVVFVGKNYRIDDEPMVTAIKANLKFLEDPEMKIYQYESGLGKPLLLLLHDGSCGGTELVLERDLAEVKGRLMDL